MRGAAGQVAEGAEPSGMSNSVMFAIIVATATTIGANGQATISSAADAAKGSLFYVLVAAGTFMVAGTIAVLVTLVR